MSNIDQQSKDCKQFPDNSLWFVARPNAKLPLGYVRPAAPASFESFDIEDRSIGVFATRAEAAIALDKGISK
jgi:hypothetical protein